MALISRRPHSGNRTQPFRRTSTPSQRRQSRCRLPPRPRPVAAGSVLGRRARVKRRGCRPCRCDRMASPRCGGPWSGSTASASGCGLQANCAMFCFRQAVLPHLAPRFRRGLTGPADSAPRHSLPSSRNVSKTSRVGCRLQRAPRGSCRGDHGRHSRPRDAVPHNGGDRKQRHAA